MDGQKPDCRIEGGKAGHPLDPSLPTEIGKRRNILSGQGRASHGKDPEKSVAGGPPLRSRAGHDDKMAQGKNGLGTAPFQKVSKGVLAHHEEGWRRERESLERPEGERWPRKPAFDVRRSPPRTARNGQFDHATSLLTRNPGTLFVGRRSRREKDHLREPQATFDLPGQGDMAIVKGVEGSAEEGGGGPIPPAIGPGDVHGRAPCILSW